MTGRLARIHTATQCFNNYSIVAWFVLSPHTLSYAAIYVHIYRTESDFGELRGPGGFQNVDPKVLNRSQSDASGRQDPTPTVEETYQDETESRNY